MQTYRYLFSILLLVQFSVNAHGQVMNIENARMHSDTTGWMGAAGAGFTMVKNTDKIYAVNVKAHVQYKTKKDLWLLLGDYSFLKSGKEKLISNSFSHLRYNRKLNSWLRWEAFIQGQKNYVLLLDLRLVTGTGPRFKIFSSDKFKLYAASLLMYEHEKERTSPVIKHNDWRSSSYITFTYLPAPTIEMNTTSFYQPKLGEIKDYRFLNQVSLKIKATKHFGMYMNWNYLYDHLPAGNSPATTYNFNSGIEFEF